MTGPRPLPTLPNGKPKAAATGDCWNRIGIWGDRSCPELAPATHCHNCPVFTAAGRRFLDAPPPADYADEWTDRLAATEEAAADGELGVLVFRLADEWLALPVSVLVEVTHRRQPHRVPHRGGLLAGLVNIRGELHLCARLDLVLGVNPSAEVPPNPRMVVVRREAEGWVFPADEVDQVHRIPARDLAPAAPTLARAAARLTRGVFRLAGRSVGLLDEVRLFHTLRERVR